MRGVSGMMGGMQGMSMGPDIGAGDALVDEIKKLLADIEGLSRQLAEDQKAIKSVQAEVTQMATQGRFAEMQSVINKGQEATKRVEETKPRLEQAKALLKSKTGELRQLVQQKKLDLSKAENLHQHKKQEVTRATAADDWQTVQRLAVELQQHKEDKDKLKGVIQMLEPHLGGGVSNAEWKLVLRQTIASQAGHFFQAGQWSLNAHDPNADNFAIMNQVEQFRNRTNQKFLFKLVWPNEGWEQIWRQSSNPTQGVRQNIVQGYEPIKVAFQENYWGGLQADGRNCLLCGSLYKNQWFYAIGSFAPYELHGQIGLPGPSITSCVQRVELYVGIE